jgi:hypothetical protein
VKARIRTQPSECRPGSFTLIVDAGVLADRTIYVLPNYEESRHLAWISTWDGETFRMTDLGAQLTDRVLRNALGGLDFGGAR